MKKKIKKIEKNCGAEVAGCEKIERMFNNLIVREPQDCIMRVPLFVSSENEYYLAIGKARNPRLVIVDGEKPYEIVENIWTCKCKILFSKGGKK